MKRIKYSVYTDTTFNNLYGYLIEDDDSSLQFVTSNEEDLTGEFTSKAITINSEIFINAITSSTKQRKQLNKENIFYTENSFEIPYQMTVNTFTTERYIVDKLYHTVLKQLEGLKSNSRHNCITLKGLRRIGKTTALYQLYNRLSLLDLKVCYINLTDSSLYDFIDSTEDIIQIYLLDEVCKLSENKLYSLINKIKNHKKNVFVLTGSVASKLEEISNRICDGCDYSLRSIMFLETLVWKYNCSYIEALKYSSNQEYRNYLKSSHLTGIEDNLKFNVNNFYSQPFNSFLNLDDYEDNNEFIRYYISYSDYNLIVMNEQIIPKIINKKFLSFIVSCNNTIYQETNYRGIVRMRNDIIICLLELALINDDNRNLTVLDLYHKYFN